MRRVLLCWIGNADLRAAKHNDPDDVGPIAQVLGTHTFDHVVLLHDYPQQRVRLFRKWLKSRTTDSVELAHEPLPNGPTAFGDIYKAALRSCETALGSQSSATQLIFHLSPGTPAMAAVWILLGKTRFSAELLESSRERGVQTVDFPFDIAVDFLPDLFRERDDQLPERSGSAPPESPEFTDILHRSRPMARWIDKARRVAVHNVPVLIEGESGTGKELFARAIHRASARRDGPFVPVNCGAIPAELVESQLFGHEKGAFSGAVRTHAGYFEAANQGTVFLDEIGELPLPAQVKLLRVVQEQEVTRVGSTKGTKIDVRIVAATNRTLTKEISLGRFREDLFYRLAVAVLKIPPLRDRKGDVSLLIDHLLERINQDAKSDPGFKAKMLSAGARQAALEHDWPGNVRELHNTLQRAAVWSERQTITVGEMREALLPPASASQAEVLGRPLGDGFNLGHVLSEVARHYLTRALTDADRNKSRAAELVGLPSYQTFSNWMKRHEL